LGANPGDDENAAKIIRIFDCIVQLFFHFSSEPIVSLHLSFLGFLKPVEQIEMVDTCKISSDDNIVKG
jgi:hypothetical protein